MVAAYEKDPQVFRGKMSAGLATVLLAAMRTVVNGAASIDLPLLILHGSEDRLTSVAGSDVGTASARRTKSS